MSTERIQKILNSELSKENTNTDAYLKISLDNSERLLPPDEIINIVNVAERFNVERQRSTFYRIIGTINLVASNPLFNLNDSYNNDEYTWSTFNYKDPITNEYRFFEPVYTTVINSNLVENQGWFGYYEPDISRTGFCGFFDMEPKRERFYFLPDIKPYNNPSLPFVKNWELTITYPHAVDSEHTLVNGGLLIADIEPAVVSTRVMTAFAMPCKHNLQVGDVVRISGTVNYDGDHIVVRTGKDNGDLKDYYFVIDANPTIGLINENSRIKRVVNNFESQYYFRRFKKIKTKNYPVMKDGDFEVYNVAFSQNIYNDSITQFCFNDDVDISNLTDNLGRPLTELYLSMIKTDSNALFSKVSSGIETPLIARLNDSPTIQYLRKIPVINKIHNGNGSPWPSHVPLELDIKINSLTNDFYGDLVEYNKYEVKETVLADVLHRFNTINREQYTAEITYISSQVNNDSTLVTTNLGPRQEGYFYKPHNLLKIKQLSTYVEQGTTATTGNIPSYASDLGNGQYFWRDILDIGVIQTNTSLIDYAFLNGSHYLYNNYCFYLRRQDPFDEWDLYYGKFPADPIGERITDNFKSNSSEDVC